MTKSLIIYFSRADENYGVSSTTKGNTEYLAEFIKSATEADMFKVEPAIPYAKDYETCTVEAKERIQTHNAPIAKPVPAIAPYETIYIGSPVYWDLMPEELTTAIKDLDFTGKTVHLFTTHEGSGLGSIPEQLKRVCKGARFGKPLAVFGHKAADAKEVIDAWLEADES